MEKDIVALNDEIFKLKIHQRDINREIEDKKYELIKKVIEAGLVDCLTVNVDRLRRHFNKINNYLSFYLPVLFNKNVC